MNAVQEELELLVDSWAAPADLAFYRGIARELYGRATPAFLALLDDESTIAIMSNAVGLLENKKPHEPRVRVSNPRRRTHGWASGHTVIEATVSDRPFLVDSITHELRRLGLEPLHVVHPIFDVGRDERGYLVRESKPPRRHREAYQLFLVHRQPETSLPAIEAAIARVLTDVKAATDDYLEMRRTVGEILAEWAGLSRKVGPTDLLQLRESIELLEWIDNKNFVFLAYRYAERIETAVGPGLRSLPGRNLGLFDDLTKDSSDNPLPHCNPPDLTALRLCSYPLITVRKSLKSSTVHRPEKIERIVIKQLDARLNVIGEHSFLGQLTSQARTTPVAQIPILRQRLQKVLELDGAPPGSHAYKQIVGIINSQPREELFWSRPDQLLRDARAIMAMRFADEVRVTVRPHPTGQGALVTVLLPRDRYNSALRQVLNYTLMETFQAASVDSQVTFGEDLEPTRVHYFLYPKVPISGVDLTTLEDRLAKLTRTWRDSYFRSGPAYSQRIQPRHSRPQPIEAAVAKRAVNW